MKIKSHSHPFFHQLFYFFHHYASVTILLSLFFFVLSIISSSHLTQSVSIKDQMDPEELATKDIDYINENFNQNPSLGIIVRKKDQRYFNNVELCQLQLTINQLVYQNNSISDFVSPFKIRQADYIDNQIIYKRIIENPCENKDFESLINPITPLIKTPWKNLFTGNDQKDIAYNFSIKENEHFGKYGHFDPKAVEKIMDSINGKIQHTIYWTGPLIAQYFTITGLEQSQWLNLVIIFIILISLRLYFGTWRSGIIYLATLSFTVSIVFGGMAFFHHSIDMLSSCLFLLLAIASIQDFIFVAQHQLQFPKNYIESHLHLIAPSFFTTLTTILGFGSLAISRLSSIRHFGIWAAIGALIEWITVFLIIPAFMKKFPFLAEWVQPQKAFSLSKVNKIAIKTPSPFISKGLLLFFISAIFSVKNFKLSQTPSEMFPKNHPYQQMINYVRATRNWEAEASLVFDSFLTENQKEKIRKNIQKNPVVTSIESYPQVLSFFQGNANDLLIKELVKTEFNISDFSKRYRNQAGAERSFVYLNTTNTAKINLLRDQISQLCPKRECFIGGEVIGFADFSKSLIETLFSSLVISLILVGITLFMLTRYFKNKHFFLLAISSFWGPSVLLTLIYFFDISINFVTCIIASTLVGLTGDNGIQFLFASGANNLENGIETRGASAFYCSFTMALCSLVFLGSYFDAPKLLGILLALGFIFSYLGDVWLLKGLIHKKSN